MDKEKATRHIEKLVGRFNKEMPEAHYAWTIEDDKVQAFAGCRTDVYELLNKEITRSKLIENGLVVLTTGGWAAPGEWEGAPSDCPDRRRVSMTMVITMDFFGSIAKFEDNGETIYAGDDTTSGPLDEAVADMVTRAKASMN